ncbi:unnamed protein product [Lymnaea stagnalis]|uniref:Uncharacterized protein n=1 Tax=Lymnaea stagnalis TaxID=6523 RepID=A0AAV2HBD2_LYMST
MEVNFNDPNELHQMNQGITQELSVTITKAGRLDALVMWFSLHLSETAHISTHTSSNSCWEQAVFPAHAVKIAQSTGSKVNLILKPGDKLNLIQCVKGAKLCIDVNRISTVDENGSDYCQTTSHNIPRFLSTIEDLCKQKVYCLSNSDVVNLNNSGIQQILNHHLREIITQTKGGNLNFVHLNHGFSPMCIQALKLGYQRGVAIACHPVHSDLLQEMATRHHVDFGRLKLVSDVDEFIELMEGDNTPQTGTTNNSPNCLAKRMTEDTSQTTPAGLSAVELRLRDNDRGVVVLCDVVDYQGRIVENLSDQLNVLKFCLSDYTSKFVLPESVEVYGVLIESQDLLCLSRIQSDDNTLGYKIGQFFNKFSTRNYQGIMLSTLSHTKLSEPFKMFTFSLKKIFDAPWSEPVSEQEKGAQTTAHGPSSKTTHNDGSDHSECVEFDTDGSSHSECDKFEIKSSFSKTLHVIGSNDITTSDSGQPASACEQTNTASMSITEKLSPSSCHECPTTAHPTDVVHKITQVYKKSDCSIKCQHEPNMTESTALSKTVDTKDCEHLENTITDLNVENNNVSLDSSSICFSPTQSITSKFDLNESVSLSKQGFEDQAKRRKINSQSKEETFEHPQSENENIDSKNMDQTQNLKIPIIQTGRVTALVYWFVQHISPTASINTLDQPLYWQQAAVMAQQSPSVLQGEVLGLECRLGNSAISFNIIHE